MGEILKFRKRDEPEYVDVLECPCGNQSFILVEDGRVVCAACGELQDIATVDFVDIGDTEDAP